MNDRINILVFSSIFDLGGAEIVTESIVSSMDRSRYRVVMCTLYDPGTIGRRIMATHKAFYHNTSRNRYDISVLFKLKRLIGREKINIIYCINQPITLFWAYILGKICSIPVISVIHNTIITSEQFKYILYKLLLPLIDKVVAVANLQRDHLINNEHIPSDLITIIYNGIDTDAFDLDIDKAGKLESLGLNRSLKTVGIVARLVHLKGIDIFLKAAAVISNTTSGVQFLVVGNGPEMHRLKRLAADIGIDGITHFLGTRTDVNEIVGTFDVAVSASRTEALPLTVLEYMAAGRCTVATRVGSVPELIRDYKTGFLVSPDNPEEMAAKVSLLLNDDQLRKTMGNNSSLLVVNRFSKKLMVQSTERLIDELVETNANANR